MAQRGPQEARFWLSGAEPSSAGGHFVPEPPLGWRTFRPRATFGWRAFCPRATFGWRAFCPIVQRNDWFYRSRKSLVILTDRERALASEWEWKDPGNAPYHHAASGSSLETPAHALCLIAERFFVQPRRAESPAGFVSRHPRMTISFPNWDMLSGNRKKTCARWELLPER